MSRKKKSSKNRKEFANLTRRELKQKAVDLKGGKCEACGYDKCLAALSFHHRDPKEKDFGISRLMISISWEEILKELAKTSLLCLNCHVSVHAGELDGYIDQ